MESNANENSKPNDDPNEVKIEENGSRASSYIYRQDVVKSKADAKTGIVTEVAGDSESDSSTDDDDDDDDEDIDMAAGPNEVDNKDLHENVTENTDNDDDDDDDDDESTPLPADHVRVLWLDESETTQSLDDVIVVDRAFLHGDYVAAASNATGQVGVVVDVNITVDLSTIDGKLINHVSSKDLKRVRDFQVGDYVVLGPWLGRIDDVLDNVTVMFDDASVCKVLKADPLRLKPVGKNLLEDARYPYYPGQRVKASSSSVFKNSRWLSGLWKASRLEGTVTNVTAGSAFVYWIASAGYGPDSSITPSEEQNPKNLRLLACFSHANWQLGDWCLLPSLKPLSTVSHGKTSLDKSESDSEVGHEETKSDLSVEPSSSSLAGSKGSVHETWPLHRKKFRKVVVKRDKKSRKKEEHFEKALQITSTKTRVDVAWQDGNIQRGLDSISLIPIENPGDHEFVAEQYVVEKPSDGNDDDSGDVSRVGVVKSVNAKERTACVRWLKSVARAEDPKEFDKEEIVSVYELEGHQDYDYCYGDVVVRLPSSHEAADVAEYEVKGDGAKNEGCTNFSDLSWVGNITGLRNGDIEVTWADGMVSMVGPQAIYVVGRDDDDDDSVGGGSEASDDAASWETVEDTEMDSLQMALENIFVQDLGMQNASAMSLDGEEHTTENVQTNGALSIPLAALGFMTRLASGIFSRGQRSTDDSSVNSGGDNEVLPHNLSDSSAVQTPICGIKEEDGVVEESDATAELLSESSRSEVGSSRFKGFDIVKDPLDHYYLGANAQNNAGRRWLKKVQQDWNILKKNLPDGIYVRVYENRMDLLRAVIVGAYGTPYQDGLFFFDFHLPPEYPDVPPSAYYHSGGWRINPNLYEEGKVCLSLLNTWTGRGNEVWDPSSSSILQVLVSLQGLVLNSKPYFNEAGYDKQVGTPEGEKNSFSYNENTFLLNCKTIMYLIRRPPKDFEDLVKEHFRERGYYILKACDAYMKGYLIGSLSEDASICESSIANANSVGFKLMLAKIVPKLLLALNEVGADCQEFKHLQDSA
ncbi:probable ubiquitin-conjugating enzyme E2 23 isoform X1 [Helianthus annuus]|uniref:probable ubiquitin-conjugating enzyme E2 23 isoform X1 n=1 Tax=Helianthus annuus TaxID=4232 RepID=UPI000B8F1A1B|nr:probable ubiquitin-conjugating enzyme E2 23 isoform X1 [Helianthus annuus]XP_021998759.1 probable ubiquitin-conjugating enzyme E2 23 isoform X1 [Helianthus annuus]